MNININVGIGDVKVAQAPNILESIGLGSCVGVTIYDKVKKIGGLAHIMLPSYQSKDISVDSHKLRYADYALPFMLDNMKKMGCSRINMAGKIIGGASMFKRNSNSFDIGKKNIEAVKNFFSQNSIKVIAEDIEGENGRSVFFDLSTGVVTVKMYGKAREEIEL